MIHSIPHPTSDALRAETEIHARGTAPLTEEWQRANYPTAEDFVRDYGASAEGFEVERALRSVAAGGSVLDVGSGYGKAALLLALRGYRVTAVEPALAFCEYLERAARIYRLPVEIYHVSGEALDLLPPLGLDACLFNASLHHCDDPVRALANCRGLLRPGGRIFLLNEPVLQPFRSKRWFRRQLERGTLVTGDYGGNEHTYRHHEYRAMLRQAGFRDIQGRIALRYSDPRSYLSVLRARPGNSLAVAGRRLYYGGIRGLLRAGAPGAPSSPRCSGSRSSSRASSG